MFTYHSEQSLFTLFYMANLKKRLKKTVGISHRKHSSEALQTYNAFRNIRHQTECLEPVQQVLLQERLNLVVHLFIYRQASEDTSLIIVPRRKVFLQKSVD